MLTNYCKEVNPSLYPGESFLQSRELYQQIIRGAALGCAFGLV